MTEPIPFPTSPYCRVRARVASIWADGPDDGTHPDWRPAVGEKVVLTPSIGSQLLTYDVGGADPIIVTVERVDCVVGADGFLTKSDDRPVYIAPTDDPLLSATGWTWTASIKGKSVPFSAPTGGVVELALFIAAPATDNTKEWVERIPELVESLRGVESITDEDGDGVATIRFSDGETADLPLPSTRIEGIEDVPGLVDLSDEVEWIKQNGEDRFDRIELTEPGDSYVIPSGWEVSYLKAGGDGAVLEIPYAQYTLGPNEYAGSWVQGLYGTLTLVSGSISQGVAMYQDRLYTPFEHLSGWNPHPEYAMLHDLPPIREGHGRPDSEESPLYDRYDEDPIGMRYYANDGGGVGAWVWAKRPDGKRVVEGDTGWRDISSGGVTIRVRREGYLVHMVLATGPTPPTETLVTPDIPLGFRSAGPPPLHHRCLGLLTRDTPEGSAVIYGSEPQGHGLTFIGPIAAHSRLHVSYRTDDAWPTTLPGTPA